MFDGVNQYPIPEDGSPNFALLEATRDYIAALPAVDNLDPDEQGDDPDPNGNDGVAWAQADWRCGTGMCFAGWAGALTGAVFPHKATDETYALPTQGDAYTTMARNLIRDADGGTWAVREYAQHVLNIDDARASQLFRGGNDLGDIDRVIDNIKNRYEIANNTN
jgi:hypothetical protein